LAKLEYARASQRDAQQWRTESRIRALALESASQIYPRGSLDGSGEDETSADDKEEVQERSMPTSEWKLGSPIRTKEREDAHSEVPLLSTDQRRNVTKRRSLDRVRDSVGSTSVPVSSLLSKRPQARKRDANYEDENARTPEGSRSDPIQSSTGKGGPAQTMLDGCAIPNFTRRQLPDKEVDPELYETLRDMWIHKKALEEDINEALEDGNNHVHQELVGQHDSINQAMFTMLHPNLKVQEDIQWHSEQKGSGSRNKTSDKPELPSFASGQGEDQFVIYFEYEEDEMPTVVWQNMPVAFLLRAAIEMLHERGVIPRPDRVVLMHEDRVMDPLVHRLSDHDIIAEDVVLVVIREESHSTVNARNDVKGFQQPDDPVYPPSFRHSFNKESSPIEKGKYYAVKKGRNVGIYETWAACERQVKSFSGAEHQSFRTKQEAYQFLAAPAREPPKKRSEQTNHDAEGLFDTARSQDKIKQSFKCPRFSGHAKDWKIWNKGFQRYLSIWDLDYVLMPDFFDIRPLSAKKLNDNKLVYFILEDATQSSPLASSYVRQAPAKNGFEAFYTLHDGFVFAGPTASTLLLNELANFRFKQDETPTELIMRLEEIFQDLEMLPDGAAVKFNDTQRIGYLLGALRHETEWRTVASAITSSQVKGDMTFRQACDELRVRCEAERAYDIIDTNVKSRKKVSAMLSQIEIAGDEETLALVSAAAKRINQDPAQPKPLNENKGDRKKKQCLAKDCKTLSPYSLCGLHFHSMVSGKTATLELINGYGNASYNVTTKRIEYPATVPADRLPPTKTKVL
jgi:hypothetical protein